MRHESLLTALALLLAPALALADIDVLVQRIMPPSMTLVTRLSGDSCTVQADRGRIEQVVLNLCLNARDASPAGGTIVVSTSAVEIDRNSARPYLNGHSGSYVDLTVSDDGEGNGLGLSMVMGIVEDHGGFIEVDSQFGVGTSISVFLPQSTAVV